MIVDPPRFILGLVLTLIAGWVAAVGFLELGGVYVTFMSGNTLQVGLNAATGHLPIVARASTAILSFLIGAVMAGLIFARSRYWAFSTGLIAEASCIGCGASLLAFRPEEGLGIIGLLAFGMGIQNHLVSKSRIDNAGTTFVTGTLFRCGDALAQRIATGEKPGLWIAYLAVSLAFVAGASAGAYAETELQRFALMPPAGCLLLLAVGAFGIEVVRAWRRRKVKRR